MNHDIEKRVEELELAVKKLQEKRERPDRVLLIVSVVTEIIALVTAITGLITLMVK